MSVLDRWVNRAAEHPPPGPFRAGFWRSPLRGPWFTAILSVALLPGITLMFLTGLASYAAYNPNLAPGNDTTPGKGLLGSWLPGWPAGPSWLYWVNQGVHVTLGLVLIPIILAKLWSVLPKLFEWPPVRSVTQLVERASLLLLVGGAVFELVTGVMNIQYYYAWPFGFYQAHYYGAWVFIAAFVVHVSFRLRTMVSALRGRSLRAELRTPVSQTTAEEPDPDHLVSADPGDHLAPWRAGNGRGRLADAGRAQCGRDHRRGDPIDRAARAARPEHGDGPDGLPGQHHRCHGGDRSD